MMSWLERSAGRVFATFLLATSVGGCGSTADATSANQIPSATQATAPTTAPTASPAPVAVDCAGGPGSNGLTAEGATFSAWTAHHEPDPDGRIGAYGPVQNDNLDRYTGVRCTSSGNVVSYNINYIPGLSPADARVALRRELPGDVRQLYDITIGAACETVGYQSATLGRVFGRADPQGLVVGVIFNPGQEQVNSLSIEIGSSPNSSGTCS